LQKPHQVVVNHDNDRSIETNTLIDPIIKLMAIANEDGILNGNMGISGIMASNAQRPHPNFNVTININL
jgi:hypothetical protein